MSPNPDFYQLTDNVSILEGCGQQKRARTQTLQKEGFKPNLHLTIPTDICAALCTLSCPDQSLPQQKGTWRLSCATPAADAGQWLRFL
jgi:hypothetical protein